MAENQRILSEEFKKQYPEYCMKSDKKIKKSKVKFLCQCRHGHVFDYRERIKFSFDNMYYAQCQGRCPVCGTTEFYFMGRDFK